MQTDNDLDDLDEYIFVVRERVGRQDELRDMSKV